MVTRDERREALASEFATASERLFVNAPVYRAVCRGVCADDFLLALAAESRDEQPAVLMLLGAVHYLVLRGAAHPLASLYRALAAGQAAVEDPFPLFRAFCRDFEDELRPLLAKGRVQTNEVGRAVYVRLGMEWASESFGAAPLFYVELGSSAGLNLNWDAFSMTIERGSARFSRGGDASPVRLACKIVGGELPAERGASLPPILGRFGVDVDPPDLGRSEDRDWLLAFVYADHPERISRAREAMRLAETSRHRVLRADVTRDLRMVCQEIPEGARLCLSRTFLSSQLPPPALEAMEAQIAELARGREIVEIGAEWANHQTELFVRRWLDGSLLSSEMLARGDAHGVRIEWLSSAGGGVCAS